MNQRERNRDRAEAAILKHPNFTDRALAELADVDGKTIGKVRKLLLKQEKIPENEKRIGKDGKCYHGNVKCNFAPLLVECQHDVVYFVRAEQTGLIKIGKAEVLAERLRSLQTINAERLEVIYAIPGGYELEDRLHHKFRDLRHHGEWFVPGKELLDFIENGLMC